MFLRIIGFCTAFLFLYGCTTSKKIPKEDTIEWQAEVAYVLMSDTMFRNSHTGLYVEALDTEEIIFDLKGDQYFTPASNTKLLTFYTSLKVLQDSISGMKMFIKEDTVIIWGTGDPSFLNPFISENHKIKELLSNLEGPIMLSSSNFQDDHYGSGWSWDDYNYGYQTDKHALPMYGNMVQFRKPLADSPLEVIPEYFEKLLIPNMDKQRSTFQRAESDNQFYYDYHKLNRVYKVERFVPYLTSYELQSKLLSEYLNKEVEVINDQRNIVSADVIKTVHVDTLYRLLLQPSDNFVAEQLLLNCGSELFDTLQTRKVIEWAKKELFHDMPHDYQWVDGSGLSRYNMTTPANMVHVLKLIDRSIDRDRLFELLPTGGESGTIKNWYASETPFVHAKTGSLRNNHCLSGYLIGDSGKIYVFSFMNSNYLVKNNELKMGMDRVLRILKQNL